MAIVLQVPLYTSFEDVHEFVRVLKLTMREVLASAPNA
jgi:hypothetical protein